MSKYTLLLFSFRSTYIKMNKKVSYADQYSCRTETKTKKKSYFEYYQDHTDDWMKIKLYFFVNEMSVTSTESNKKLLKALRLECL